MKLKIARFFFRGSMLLFLVHSCALGQSASSNDLKKQLLSNIPQEEVFVHYNNSLLFVGEYLYYKLYVLNADSGGLSTISKVSYIELVTKEKRTVFKHKVFLEGSSGQGDFFIPSDVPTGDYKLIAYTQWMRNGSKNRLFQATIHIINPYRSQHSNTVTQKTEDSVLKESLTNITGLSGMARASTLHISHDKNIYKKRAKVSLKLRYEDKSLENGIFSISVRKIDSVTISNRSTSKILTPDKSRLNTTKVEHLPELRGELIRGKVVSINGTSPLNNVKISISIPEELGYQLKVVATDDNGNFHASLDKKYRRAKVIIQVLGETRLDYKIELEERPKLDYPRMVFENIQISPNMKDMIIERSVHNQIENSYFSVKPDSLKPLSVLFSIDMERMTTYNLDDYTRFATIRETLVEVVDLVWSKRILDKMAFQVKPHIYDYYMTNETLPLLIVDGIQVQDHVSLLDYNARNVKRIRFLRDKYIIGPEIFQGVIMIETIDKDYQSPNFEDHGVILNLNPPQLNKKYFKQEYHSEDVSLKDSLLDFRYQLLWEPNLSLHENETNLNFYTSDITGDFEIVVEGFSEKGKPISLRRIITVE